MRAMHSGIRSAIEFKRTAKAHQAFRSASSKRSEDVECVWIQTVRGHRCIAAGGRCDSGACPVCLTSLVLCECELIRHSVYAHLLSCTSRGVPIPFWNSTKAVLVLVLGVRSIRITHSSVLRCASFLSDHGLAFFAIVLVTIFSFILDPSKCLCSSIRFRDTNHCPSTERSVSALIEARYLCVDGVLTTFTTCAPGNWDGQILFFVATRPAGDGACAKADCRGISRKVWAKRRQGTGNVPVRIDFPITSTFQKLTRIYVAGADGDVPPIR